MEKAASQMTYSRYLPNMETPFQDMIYFISSFKAEESSLEHEAFWKSSDTRQPHCSAVPPHRYLTPSENGIKDMSTVYNNSNEAAPFLHPLSSCIQ